MKIKKNELMFFIGIIILAFKSLFSVSIIINVSDFVSNILLFVSYFCFIFNIIINKINLKELRNICIFISNRTFYIYLL